MSEVRVISFPPVFECFIQFYKNAESTTNKLNNNITKESFKL